MPAPTLPATVPELHRAVAPLTDVEIRDQSATGDGSWTFTGYAAVTGVVTTLYEGRSWVWQERITPGAFRAVLDRVRAGTEPYDVVLNHEHQNAAAMASTARSASEFGGLELSEDTRGLRAFARLDPDDPDVQRVVPKVRHNVVRQMSFAFNIAAGGFRTTITEDADGREVWLDDIDEISRLYDVTLCAHGAYPQTTADIRGYLAALGRSGIDPEGPDVRRLIRGAQSPEPVAPPGAGGADPDRARRLAAIRRRVTTAVALHSHRS